MVEDNKLYGVVILKAKEILDFIMKCAEAPTLKEISTNVSMTKPTVLKILKTLEHCGYVYKSSKDSKYYLGTIFLRYGSHVVNSIDISNIVLPILSKLRDKTNETVNLGIIQNNKVILIDKLESPQSVKLESIVGGEMNMYSSAMGKSVLASYSEKKLQKYFNETELLPLTEYTIIDKEKLIQNLKEVKKNGYAIEREENQLEVTCVGFSIIKDNHVYGTFSITAPKYRINERVLELFIGEGKKAQQEISQKL